MSSLTWQPKWQLELNDLYPTDTQGILPTKNNNKKTNKNKQNSKKKKKFEMIVSLYLELISIPQSCIVA